MLFHLNIDGALSELQVEPDTLIWWRASHGTQRNQDESPIRQLVRHLSSSSLNQPHQEEQHSTPTGSIVATPNSPWRELEQAGGKKRKRVEFNQVLGVVKVLQNEKRKRHGQNEAKISKGSNSVAPTSAVGQYDQKQAPISKLKVYFAKRSEKASSNRLLKLKRLVVELAESKRTPHLHPNSAEGGPTGGPQSVSLADLHDLIGQHIELKRRQRPKRLLIFVNPFGGKGKAVHLFETKVKRVLDLAQVESELIVTRYANHARETLEDPAFSVDHFDGIICVGGDGMFAELMNGLLFRYNRERLLRSFISLDRRETHPDSSSDLDSIASSSSSTSSASSSSSTTSALSPLATRCHSDDMHSDTKTNVMIETNDRNEEGTCELLQTEMKRQLTYERESNLKQSAQTFQQQMKFLRSSLGGIGERFDSPSIPIGVIGAGSTDANLFGFIGTNDVISATLNIILGNQIQIDVCSIHSIHDDRLLRFVSTFVAYGYFGDVVRESEKLRWLGPSRYDVTALNSLIKYRNYDGLVRILRSPRDGTPRDLNRCHLNCSLCQNSVSNSLSFNDFSHLSKSRDEHELAAADEDKNDDDDLHHHTHRHDHQHPYHHHGSQKVKSGKALDDLDQFEIIERRGPFMGVNAAVTACRCPQTRKGFSPGNHLANGCVDLILVRPCSRMQYINYLVRTGYTNKSAFDLKYVEPFRCRQFEFIVEDAATEISRDQSSSSSAGENSFISGSSNTIKQSSYESGVSLASDTLSSRDNQRCEQTDSHTASSWNADGEILTDQSIRVKVNNKLLRVFGTGEPAQVSQKLKNQN